MWDRLAVCACLVVAGAAQEFRDVSIESGTVRGYADVRGDIIEFMNVPYATAPTGRDRFQAPSLPPVWTGTFEAVYRDVRCPQSTALAVSIEEDCLVANIFIPASGGTNLPVVINTHGGGYNSGHGENDNVRALVRTQNIIGITYNYRLGAHGFLCLGTEGAPGNTGMRDQVAMVQWVKRNIVNFGGNPNEVIVMGCSAGSGSSDLLTLTPMLAGQISRAIIQSGCNMGGVGIQLDPLENAKMYARMLDFEDVDDIEALDEFFRTIPIEVLISQTSNLVGRPTSSIPFSPCVEKDVGIERFLPDAPINIISSGSYSSIPLLYGFTNGEGMMRLGNYENWSAGMNEKFSDFLSEDLQFDSEEQKEEVAQSIKEFYFGDQPVDPVGFVEYFTDVLFFNPMLRALKLRQESLGEPAYLFEYSFYDENTATIGDTDVRGSTHCTQANAVTQENPNNPTAEFLNMQTIMREYWTSFILTGNPITPGSTLTPWPATNASWSPYMSLGRTVELSDTLRKIDQALFWEDIYSRHLRVPVPPGSGSTTHSISMIALALALASYLNVF